jgi:hypothetical protein
MRHLEMGPYVGVPIIQLQHNFNALHFNLTLSKCSKNFSLKQLKKQISSINASPSNMLWIPIYNYLYQNLYRVSI